MPDDPDYEFTQDWSKAFRQNEEQYLRPLLSKLPSLSYLELGVFEGRSGVHMLTAYPVLHYVGVDSWRHEHLNPKKYPAEIAEYEIVEIERRARANLSRAAKGWRVQNGGEGSVTLHKESTLSYFARELEGCLSTEDAFDLIYVDAAHHALDVLIEASAAWRMLKVGGVMVFDDFKDRGARNSVKPGVKAWLRVVSADILFQNHQLGLIKLAPSGSQAAYRRDHLKA